MGLMDDPPVNIMMSTSMWPPVLRAFNRMNEQAAAIGLHADGDARHVRALVMEHVLNMPPPSEQTVADDMCVKSTLEVLGTALKRMAHDQALPDMLPCLLAAPLVLKLMTMACEDEEIHWSTRRKLMGVRAELGESAIDLLAGLV